MAYATLPVAGDFNGTNELTSTNRPTGAVGMGILSPNGGFKKLIAFGNVPGSSTPGGFTRIAQGINLSDAQALLTNQPPATKVVSNVLYAIEDNAWNGGNGDNMAWVPGLDGNTFDVKGTGFVGGVLQVVTVDVAAGTYVPFAAGAAGAPRDPLAIGDDLQVTAAVMDASNTWQDGDLLSYGNATLQDAGAPPAVVGQHASVLVGAADVATLDEFNGQDSDGITWVYRYTRRTDGTSGWTRTRKAGPVLITDSAGLDWAVTVNTSGNLVTTQL